MGTNEFRSSPEASREPSLGELWQVPTFLAGVIALAGTLLAYFWLPDSPATILRRDLRQAEELLAAGDHVAALDIARRSLDAIDAAPRLQGEFCLIRGSALLLRAEDLAGPERSETYVEARAWLEWAQSHGVAKANELPLRYRLARARYFTGADLQEVAAELDNVLELYPEGRLEGYALLTSIHLQRTKPNLDAALRANERLLALTNLENPNPVRLQRGDLLLRAKRGAEAREVLGRIPPGTPEFAKARHLQAWSLFEEQDWRGAIDIWEKAKAEPLENPAQQAQALYGMGMCYLEIGRDADAEQVWRRLLQEHPSRDEALVVALRLAELRAQAGQHEDALKLYSHVLRPLTPGFRNAYLDEVQVRTLVKQQWQRWYEAGRHEEAIQLARLARQLLPANDLLYRVALARQASGSALLRAALPATAEARDQQLAEARRHLLEAGDHFESAAQQAENQQQRGELLWAAAECFLNAKEYARGAVILERYQALGPDMPQSVAARVALGEAYQALKRPDAACRILTPVADEKGPHQARARYLLALSLLDRNDAAGAEKMLRLLLTMPALDRSAPEPRLALFALMHVLFRREEYGDAAQFIEQALEQAASDELVLWYWLGEAYRRGAAKEKKNISSADTLAAREFYQKLKRTQLEKAVQQFQRVVAALQDRRNTAPLSVEQEQQLRESRFGVGECLYDLGRYGEAADVYDQLAKDCGERVEGLTALMHLTQCYWALRRYGEARTALEALQRNLEKVSDRDLEFAKTTRQAWQAWLDGALATSRSQ
jgi:tetratricopeptide (TPR) repeat protein